MTTLRHQPVTAPEESIPIDAEDDTGTLPGPDFWLDGETHARPVASNQRREYDPYNHFGRP